MKVLWVCTMMLPEFAPYFDEEPSPFGGWLTGLFAGLKDCVTLDICCPSNKYPNGYHKNINGTTVYTYQESKDLTGVMTDVLLSVKPDVVHIWGTEEKITLDTLIAAEKIGIIDRVVVSIQGLVSIYSRYHYFAFLPQDIANSCSPVEYKYHISLSNNQKEMALRGKYEIEALKKARNVIGRTDWDEACVTQISPLIKYYKCNESLRSTFYENTWNYDKCEKHSIFVSQSNYPLKGFHLMLEAMPMILQKYPDAKLYATGQKPEVPKTFKEKYAKLAYPAYIAKLINDNNLNEHVNFLGRLNEEKMCSQYLKSNVFVSPSSIENSSNSIGEAMLLGMPVVSSDVGGVKNFLIHEKEGYIYQADAPYMLAYYVCKVFDDSERAKTIGINAKLHAQDCYNREVNTKQMIAVYSDIIRGSKENA